MGLREFSLKRLVICVLQMTCLIVDYIGIVKALRKALADYTANAGGNGGSDPTINKDELIARIIETIGKANAFLNENDFDLEMLINAYDFMKLSYLQEAANAVCGSIEDKKTFTTYASELNRLMRYMDRDDITGHTRNIKSTRFFLYSQTCMLNFNIRSYGRNQWNYKFLC